VAEDVRNELAHDREEGLVDVVDDDALAARFDERPLELDARPPRG
jgi:hypothetical protein